MHIKKILLTAFVIFLLPVSFSHGASSLYSTQILNTNYVPIIKTESTPTISTLLNTSTHTQIRHQGTAVAHYTGMLLERPVGNIPNTSAIYVTYAYVRNAGTCTFALRHGTTNVTGASISLTATTPTTTVTWTGMATNGVVSPATQVSLSIGGTANCNGTLNIIRVATDNPGIVPLSYDALQSTTNDILYVSTSTASTTSTTIDYSRYFDLFILFVAISVFTLIIHFFRFITKKYL